MIVRHVNRRARAVLAYTALLVSGCDLSTAPRIATAATAGGPSPAAHAQVHEPAVRTDEPASSAEAPMTSEIPALRWPDGGLVTLPPLAPLDAGEMEGPTLDAGVRVDTDAASAPDGGSMALDAGSAGSPATPPVPPSAPAQGAPCRGASALGLCWYLGAAARSCNDTCAAHGGFDTRAIGRVGTSRQGGSQEECARVMDALGREAPRGPAMRDDLGLGCHVFSDDVSYWLDDPSPPFAPDVTGAPQQVRIACACLR